MTMLSRVTTGKIVKPKLILLHSIDGIGKSTFASQATCPIFIGAEEGTNNLDVARTPTPETWDEVVSVLDELATEAHPYKTLVIDTLDWLEPVLYRSICKRYNVKTIELACGGYGKGYLEGLTEWQKLIMQLNKCRNKGMNIILLAHSEIVKFSDPRLQADYDRYQVKLYKKTTALFKEYVDSILFATLRTETTTENSKVRVFGDGDRVMYTEARPGFDAKNRFSLPFELTLSWQSYCDAVKTNTIEQKPEQVYERIMGAVAGIDDKEKQKSVLDAVEKNKEDINYLLRAEKRIGEITK